MGIYGISEANRTIRCLEIKAYDYMLRFEKDFNITETIGNAYEIIMLCCKACSVEFAHTQAEIESMPNGSEVLSVYSENDIETYRDVLFYIGQVLGGFFCINRNGKLELRKYGSEPIIDISNKQRFSSSFSDFITRYTADIFVIKYVPFDSETIGKMLPLDKIKAFHDHPFHLYETERLQDIMESIKEHGVRRPVIIQKKKGGYEMLSGHNRVNAAKLSGLEEIPAIINVTIMSRNTGHYWYLHNPEYPEQGTVIIFHSHHVDRSGRVRYHLHGKANTLRQAVRSIRGRDRWQLNGRRW